MWAWEDSDDRRQAPDRSVRSGSRAPVPKAPDLPVSRPPKAVRPWKSAGLTGQSVTARGRAAHRCAGGGACCAVRSGRRCPRAGRGRTGDDPQAEGRPRPPTASGSQHPPTWPTAAHASRSGHGRLQTATHRLPGTEDRSVASRSGWLLSLPSASCTSSRRIPATGARNPARHSSVPETTGFQ